MKMFAGAAAAMILAGSALAQEVDFGAWCSEIARLDADRCIERRPDDVATYNRYAESVRLFDDEKLKRDEARRLEIERVNRMGDVTADQVHDSAIGR